MKRQNGVVLSGKLGDLRAEQVSVGDASGLLVRATLVTDHPAYGGHHRVVFPEEHALEVQAFAALTAGDLEVTVEGWLRSTPAAGDSPPSAVVVVDRVIYLNVTQAQRDQVARARAAGKQRSARRAP